MLSKGAWATLERPHGRGRWFADGDRVDMRQVEGERDSRGEAVAYPEETDVENQRR